MWKDRETEEGREDTEDIDGGPDAKEDGAGRGAQDSEGADCRGSGADRYCGGSWASGSCFPHEALNEVIVSINSGIDQFGEPWRRGW